MLRLATLTDAPALALFAERVFIETFSAHNTAEDMTAYCANAFGEAQETRQLSDPARTCLLAEIDGAVAAYAYLVIGSTSPVIAGEVPVEIQRFYVDQRWHGRGLAQQLMDRCITEAMARGGRTLWLGVWEQNARAIRFYEKFGFRAVGSQRFMLGSDAQHDLVLSRALSE